MTEVNIYTTANCNYCVQAKQLLDKKGVSYHELRVDNSPETLEEMLRVTEQKSVPQIVINGKTIGGFNELWSLEKSGQLDALLAEN